MVAARGLMIQSLRRLNEPAPDSHFGMALAVAAVALSLMLWVVIWQYSIVVYQRDFTRVMWTTQFGTFG